MTQWERDVLGEGFEHAVLPLGEDDEGPLDATLVRSLPGRRSWWRDFTQAAPRYRDVSVLYVHGWSDYFFQRDLARFWTDRGARFYALDLRKYGRSYREGQTHGYVEDLADYDLEMSRAIDIIRAEGYRKLVLLGHSTGGLVLSLWAARNPGVADALVLNSPWLQFQFGGAIRKLIATILDLSVKINPRESAPQLDLGFYNRAQNEILGDRVRDINPEWRPDRSMPIRAGWLHAILQGHDQVERGLDLDVPVCVLLSQRSVAPVKWTEEFLKADSVLNVDEVAAAAVRLGTSVTVERIEGALHDVFISADSARSESYARMDRWVAGFVTP